MLLGFPQSLQQGGGAPVPQPGALLPEGSAEPPEELGQRGVAAPVGPLVLQLAGESQVRAAAAERRLRKHADSPRALVCLRAVAIPP